MARALCHVVQPGTPRLTTSSAIPSWAARRTSDDATVWSSRWPSPKATDPPVNHTSTLGQSTQVEDAVFRTPSLTVVKRPSYVPVVVPVVGSSGRAPASSCCSRWSSSAKGTPRYAGSWEKRTSASRSTYGPGSQTAVASSPAASAATVASAAAHARWRRRRSRGGVGAKGAKARRRSSSDVVARTTHVDVDRRRRRRSPIRLTSPGG